MVELWHRPGLASRTSLVLTQDVSSFPIAALHSITDANPDSQVESELVSDTLRARSTLLERALVSASEARIVSPVGFHALSSFFAWTLGLLSLLVDIQILLRPQEFRTGHFVSGCCVVLQR